MSKNESILIDLDFSPEWARKPASAQMHAGSDKRPLSKHSSRSGKDFERREKKHPAKPFKRRETPEMPQRGRESGAPTDRFASKESEASREYLPIPVRISFIPERSGLKPVAQWLAGTMKAHSLISIASMFLSKPEYFAVKLESLTTQDNAPETTMYQCGICKIVYLDKEKIVAHLLDKHQDEFYKTEEVSVDPPKGNFLCVAQCRVSGVLLGPPNYHGYNTIMADMQRTRFPHLSMEEYRNQIVIRKEQEIIDQWKNEVCQQIRYTTLKAQEPAVLESRGEVE